VRNTDFQNRIKPGDTILINDDSTRFNGGEEFKFIKFMHCKNLGACDGCKGLVKFSSSKEQGKTWSNWGATDCMREYNDGDIMDYLVVRCDILEGPNWLNDIDWEL
jgi:hypothetical protein